MDNFEPAFPLEFIDQDTDSKYFDEQFVNMGITVRDYFAAAALKGLCNKEQFAAGTTTPGESQIAFRAYLYADEMMKLRDKGME